MPTMLQQYSSFEAKPPLCKSLAIHTTYEHLLPMGTSHFDNVNRHHPGGLPTTPLSIITPIHTCQTDMMLVPTSLNSHHFFTDNVGNSIYVPAVPSSPPIASEIEYLNVYVYINYDWVILQSWLEPLILTRDFLSLKISIKISINI